MDNGLAMVVVAAITATGGIVVALIQSLRKENKQDHAVVQARLKLLSQIAIRTENKVDTVKEELEDHLHWHKGDDNGESRKRDKGRGASASQQVSD